MIRTCRDRFNKHAQCHWTHVRAGPVNTNLDLHLGGPCFFHFLLGNAAYIIPKAHLVLFKKNNESFSKVFSLPEMGNGTPYGGPHINPINASPLPTRISGASSRRPLKKSQKFSFAPDGRSFLACIYHVTTTSPGARKKQRESPYFVRTHVQ